MGARFGTLLALGAHQRLRRIYLSFAGFSLAEHATWLATLVYAFERGGVGNAGRIAVIALLAAMVVAPFAAWSGDRFRPDRALFVAYLVQATAAGATALAMHLGEAQLAYAGAVLVVCAVTVSRPLVSSLLPLIVSRPADLVASNVVIGSTGQLGLFLGPLLAAALMAAGSPVLVFAVSAALLAAGALAVARFRSADVPESSMTAGGVVSSVFAGLTSVWGARSLGAVVALMFTGALVGGIGDVAIVTFADERLGGGGELAGVLGAAIGLGGLVGIVSVSASTGRSRLATRLVVASIAAGFPIAAMGGTSSSAAAVVLLAASGVGLGMVAVLGTVAIQRLASEETLARVFGVQESLRMAALAVGAGLATVSIERLGLGPALVWLGSGATIAGVACTAWFVRSGADVPPPDHEIVDRIVEDPLFEPLGVRAIERLAEAAERRVWPSGSVIIAEGEVGRRYFLLVEGSVGVWEQESWMRRLGPADSFGEIALLEDRPRTATVRAESDVTALTIDRDRFLTAVTGHPRSFLNASAVVNRYLGRPEDSD